MEELTIQVRIPETLRQYSGDWDQIAVAGPSVAEALQQIRSSRPALYCCVCDETGAVRKHIHIFVNSERIPVHKPLGLNTVLKMGDLLTIWTAVSGG